MSVNNASTDVSSSSSDVTVVLGVQNVHRVAMIAGIASDGEFKPNKEGFAANVHPEGGYVVVQLPARSGKTVYAITQVLPAAGGKSFDDCGWKQALAFEANGGKVVYLGDLNFHVDGQQLRFEHNNDIEHARLFIDANYPKLRGLVEYVEPRVLPHAKADCASRRGYEYRIIFLGRRR
jgi:hypothetical protein